MSRQDLDTPLSPVLPLVSRPGKLLQFTEGAGREMTIRQRPFVRPADLRLVNS
jgi:hypothetical protein